MSEINFTEKITEVLTDIVKKYSIFEKTEKYKKIFLYFIFFTTITNTFLLTTNFYNFYGLINLRVRIKKLQTIESKIEKMYNDNKLLHEEILKLQNNSREKFNDIENLISSLSICDNLKLHECKSENVVENYYVCNECNSSNDNTENSETNQIIDELIDECYDNIPCNNIKKHTLFNNLFKW